MTTQATLSNSSPSDAGAFLQGALTDAFLAEAAAAGEAAGQLLPGGERPAAWWMEAPPTAGCPGWTEALGCTVIGCPPDAQVSEKDSGPPCVTLTPCTPDKVCTDGTMGCTMPQPSK